MAEDRAGDRDIEFGMKAVEVGAVQPLHLQSALRKLNERRVLGERTSLPQILIEMGLVEKPQVKEILGKLGTTLLICTNAACGATYNVRAFDPGRKYKCKKCGSPLRPENPDDAGELTREEAAAGAEPDQPPAEPDTGPDGAPQPRPGFKIVTIAGVPMEVPDTGEDAGGAAAPAPDAAEGEGGFSPYGGAHDDAPMPRTLSAAGLGEDEADAGGPGPDSTSPTLTQAPHGTPLTDTAADGEIQRPRRGFGAPPPRDDEGATSPDADEAAARDAQSRPVSATSAEALAQMGKAPKKGGGGGLVLVLVVVLLLGGGAAGAYFAGLFDPPKPNGGGGTPTLTDSDKARIYLAARDADKDGALSEAEYDGGYGEFAEVDGNGDGTLDVEELLAADTAPPHDGPQPPTDPYAPLDEAVDRIIARDVAPAAMRAELAVALEGAEVIHVQGTIMIAKLDWLLGDVASARAAFETVCSHATDKSRPGDRAIRAEAFFLLGLTHLLDEVAVQGSRALADRWFRQGTRLGDDAGAPYVAACRALFQRDPEPVADLRHTAGDFARGLLNAEWALPGSGRIFADHPQASTVIAARENLDAATEAQPFLGAVRRFLGLLYGACEPIDPEGSRMLLDTAMPDANDGVTELYRALSAWRNGRIDDAKAGLTAVREATDGPLPRATVLEAVIAYADGEFQRALAQLELVGDVIPMPELSGRILLERGEYSQLVEALQGIDGPPRALGHLGLAWLMLGRNEEALAALELAEAGTAEDAVLRARYALALHRARGDAERRNVQRAFREARELDTAHIEPLLWQARVQLDDAIDFNAAEPLLEAAGRVEAKPWQEFFLHLYRGIFYRQKDPSTALEAFETADTLATSEAMRALLREARGR
jgi:tetratricopeptide (TPR) repeat protein